MLDIVLNKRETTVSNKCVYVLNAIRNNKNDFVYDLGAAEY
jgi:hypothetical protein